MQRRNLIIASACVAVAGVSGGLAMRGRGRAYAADPVHAPAGLFDDPGSPVQGPAGAPLPIAEFFDYRCPFCRRMHPLLQRLLREDDKVRLIAKEWPVFGGPSVTAARVALAANLQGRFAAVNDALFTATLTDDDAVRAAAQQAGVDMTRLDADLKTHGEAITATLQQTAMQADGLGLQGTPGFVIGSILVPGALSYADLRRAVSDARTRQRHGAEQ